MRRGIVPSEHNYPLYDKLMLVGVAAIVVSCAFLLPLDFFWNALGGAVIGGAVFFAYTIVRPSDAEIELYGLMANTASQINKLPESKLRETLALVAVTIYEEGVPKHKNSVRHLNEVVLSAAEGVSATKIMPVVLDIKAAVEKDRQRRFQLAEERVEFLRKFYGVTGKTSEAVKLLEKIINSEKIA